MSDQVDFGEPLRMAEDQIGRFILNHIADRDGLPFAQVIHGNLDMKRERIISCVNACVGMEDPAAEIAALREEVERLSEIERVAKDFVDYSDRSQEDDYLYYDEKLEAVRAALARKEEK